MFRFDLDSDALAQDYGRASPLLFVSGRTLVRALHLASGHHVLDVGCGTGLLADYASRIVGPEGLVIGIDPLPLRVAIAQRRQRPNLRFQVGTAADLREFLPESFDAAYMHLVFHWLPEKGPPLRELSRVLKPGAPFGLTTSARECENTFEVAYAEVLSRHPYTAWPDAGEARGRRVTSTELTTLLRDTGFRLTHMETEPTLAEWPDADQAVAFADTISAGNLFGHLPEPLRQPARRELSANLESRRHGQTIRIEGARIVAVASRV